MKRLSLSFILPTAIVGLALTTALVMSVFSLIGTRATLVEETEQRLEVVLDQRISDLTYWFNGMARNMTDTAASPQMVSAVDGFVRGWSNMGADAEPILRGLYRVDAGESAGRDRRPADDAASSLYYKTHVEFHPLLSGMLGQLNLYDIFLLDRDGNIVYTVSKESDFTQNVVTGPLAQSGLGRVFQKAIGMAPGTIVFDDVDPYGPSNNEPSAFLATPITDQSGTVIGIYAVQFTTDKISLLMSNSSGLEQTGRVVLVAADGTRRNAPRFEGDPAVDEMFPVTPQLEAALGGGDGTMADTVNDKGVEVIAAYESFDVFDTSWSVIAEQNREEALEPMGPLVRNLIIEIAILSLLATVAGWLIGRWVSNPLRRLSIATVGVADRTFTDEIPAIARRDEIGDVARSLDDFREKLAAADATAREVLFKSSAFVGSSVAMLISDTEGKIIYHNAAARDLFDARKSDLRAFWPDFDPNALVGMDISGFHENHARIAGILKDPSKLPFRSDITVGEAKFSINVTAVHDERGEYVGNVVEWADVAEVRLNAGILDAIRRNQTVIEIDLEGRIVEVNDQFVTTYGYERTEVIGKSFEMLMPPGSKLDSIMPTLTSTGHLNEKVSRRGKDGREVWVESSINAIKDQSGQVFKLIEIATDVTDAEREMRDAQERREAMEAAQRSVVNALREGLSTLAAGDLSSSLEDAFPAEYEELRGDFNLAVTQLRDVLGLVVETSVNIRNGASEISQAADDLSRRTESQAATLEETAAAMDELTESVKSASDGATEADRVVRDAREKAEASGLVVVDAVNAMSEIEKSSQQISQIIGVIDDIAFQTNLLALNAGVEAARAGEAGRGFAVVASEVRGLAQRSSEAAKEIKQLISTSSRYVENGVGLVGQAGDALKTIVSSVTEISELVTEIASSSKEQATGLTEINSGVTMLDQVTQQNAAMVEQSTAASHSLRQEAEGLTKLVDRFRIDGATAAPAIPVRGAAMVPAEKPVTIKKAVGSDVSPDLSGKGDEGWESF